MYRLNKRGQFFLVAAFVIIGLMVSLNVVYNSADSPTEDNTLEYLSEEINVESSQVIDSGIYNNQEDSIPDKINSLSQIYAKSNPEKDFTFIVGDKKKIYVSTREVTGNNKLTIIGAKENSERPTEVNEEISSGSISLDGDATLKTSDSPLVIRTFDVYQGTERITLSFDSENSKIERSFDLKNGQNFYLVLKKEKGDEKIVITN